MRARILVLTFVLPFAGLAQAITGLNFREWYNPDAEVLVTLTAARFSSEYEVDFSIQTPAQPRSKYTITWERRDSYTQREGTALTQSPATNHETEKTLQGTWRFPVPATPWLLVLKVTNTESKTSWVYFERIDPQFPTNGWVQKNQQKVIEKYLILNQAYQAYAADASPFYVSAYYVDFPPANPPFSPEAAPADRFMFYDSTFRVVPGQPFTLKKPGAYLFQRDTNAAEGFAYIGTRDVFPKFSSIADLAQPLLYITTPDEFKALVAAGTDKAKFDKVILDITNDKERAKNFMRSYFRRVELANQYFTSYKHGWKTDRGMIYTIFGLPDEVSVNDGTETWFYKNSRTRFTFVRRGSVYDPEHYVLLRDKRFTEVWFSTIDLWRKSRF
ncbi:MAG: GWxTD domain-containing protein [Cytophagales bacterium]|nr:GWxTD domain-containing protein [Cytophagales bacterium]